MSAASRSAARRPWESGGGAVGAYTGLGLGASAYGAYPHGGGSMLGSGGGTYGGELCREYGDAGHQGLRESRGLGSSLKVSWTECNTVSKILRRSSGETALMRS